MNRKDFLTLKSPQKKEGNTKFAAPSKVTRRTATGIAEYTGTWSKWEVKHLLSRTLFGYTHADIAKYTAKSMADTVDELLNISSTEPAPPTNDYVSTMQDPECAENDVWVNTNNSVNFNFQRRNSLRNWWMRLMVNDTTIREKMTLFWHNHFATESENIGDARTVYTLLKTLRTHCLGNVKALTKAVTLEPGMLKYLNGYLNNKVAPDENYGRELQELFTVGKGSGSNYTEDDVKASARVLTGWRINNGVNPPVSYFHLNWHETADKQFSSFYGNTKITGKNSPTAGMEELDDMLAMIFAQNEVAKHICRRIYTFFVYYTIDSNTETNVIEPLAAMLKANNYNIKSVMDTLLKSEHFYDMANRGCIIKQPVDYFFALAKHAYLNIPVGTEANTVKYTHQKYLVEIAAYSGQTLLDPPSVAGWQAYYQAPSFHELWITSNTMPVRVAVVGQFITSGYSRGGHTMKMNVFSLAEKFSNPSNPNTLVKESLEYFLSMPPSATLLASTKTFLLPGNLPDSTWTTVWNTYKSNPGDTTNTKTCSDLLTYMFYSILNLAEYQLQ